MASPESKMILISNVFSRFMFFKEAGDVEQGHKHHYHHATLVSSGSVKYEVLDGSESKNVIATKTFTAPAFVFVHKDEVHRITALEPNTVCACIHALRDETGQLLDPDYLIDEFDAEGKPIRLGLTSNRDPSLVTALTPICNINYNTPNQQ